MKENFTRNNTLYHSSSTNLFEKLAGKSLSLNRNVELKGSGPLAVNSK